LTCLSRLVAILLLKAGIDPDQTWYDEVISLPLGVFILVHFQNDPLSILCNVLIDVIPEATRKLGEHRRARQVHPHSRSDNPGATALRFPGGRKRF
jgi:hypothetical protein